MAKQKLLVIGGDPGLQKQLRCKSTHTRSCRRATATATAHWCSCGATSLLS